MSLKYGELTIFKILAVHHRLKIVAFACCFTLCTKFERNWPILRCRLWPISNIAAVCHFDFFTGATL